MAASPPSHLCHVVGSPWPGVFGTRLDSARHYGRHWHDTFGFGLLEQGAQHSASGRGPVQAYAGDLITSNPGEVHDGRPLGGPTRRWRMLYLEPQAMAGLAGTGVTGLALTRPVLQDLPLRRSLLRLFTRLDRWNGARTEALDTDRMACDEALAEACGLLLQRHATCRPEEEAAADLRRVRDRLAEELLAPPTLQELSAMTSLSRYQLLRHFRQAFGVPPHAWLLQQRAERARRLILRGRRLAEVAADCGFADQSHMTRVFTRHFGFTPGACQRAAQ
jgi:AraC-like DNA-binding protein